MHCSKHWGDPIKISSLLGLIFQRKDHHNKNIKINGDKWATGQGARRAGRVVFGVWGERDDSSKLGCQIRPHWEGGIWVKPQRRWGVGHVHVASRRRMFQVEGRGDAKALAKEQAWYFQGKARKLHAVEEAGGTRVPDYAASCWPFKGLRLLLWDGKSFDGFNKRLVLNSSFVLLRKPCKEARLAVKWWIRLLKWLRWERTVA